MCTPPAPPPPADGSFVCPPVGWCQPSQNPSGPDGKMCQSFCSPLCPEGQYECPEDYDSSGCPMPPTCSCSNKLAQNLMTGGDAPSPLSLLAMRGSKPVLMAPMIGAATRGSLVYQLCLHALFHHCLHQPCLEIKDLFLSLNKQRLNCSELIHTLHSSLVMHSIVTCNLKPIF